MSSIYGRPVKVSCANCSKETIVHGKRFHISKTGIFCCSRECAAENLKKRNLNAKCSVCGKKFHVEPGYLKNMVHPENITCSIGCAAIKRKETMRGEKNHQYGLKGDLNDSHRSDIRINQYGYVQVKNIGHPRANKDQFMFLHRLIMEEYLLNTNQYEYLILVDGRYILDPTLHVHHIDKNRINNTLINLEILTMEEHMSHHASEDSQLRQRDSAGKFMPGKIRQGLLTKAHYLDAGQDVYSNRRVIIPAGDSRVISTNLFINVPEGCVGLLWSKSGLSVKYNIEVGAGCIDSGYTGEVKVHLYNHGMEPYLVNKGNKIAQLLTIPIALEPYEQSYTLPETERGEGGFGSTGNTA